MGLGHQQVPEAVGHGVVILCSWRSCTYRHEEGLAGVGKAEGERLLRAGGAAAHHDAIRVKPGLPPPHLPHELGHRLQQQRQIAYWLAKMIRQGRCSVAFALVSSYLIINLVQLYHRLLCLMRVSAHLSELREAVVVLEIGDPLELRGALRRANGRLRVGLAPLLDQVQRELQHRR